MGAPPALSPRAALEWGWDAIRARARIMIAVPLLAALVVVVLNASAPHEARAILSFPSPDRTGALAELGIPGVPEPLAQELLADSVLERMRADRLTGVPETMDTLRPKLRVEGGPVPGTVTLVARGSSDEEAVELVDGWATAITRARARELRAQFRSVRATLRKLRRRSRGGRATSLDRREVDRRLASLLAVESTRPVGTEIVEAGAGIPRANLRNELLALGGGALIAALICLGLELWDPRVRSRPGAEWSFGHRVVGAVGDSGDDPDPLLAEKTLGAAKVLAVTSGGHVPEPAAAVAGVAGSLTARATPAGAVVWRDPGLAEAVTAAGLEVQHLDSSAEELEHRVTELRGQLELVLVILPPLRDMPSALLASRFVDGWLVLAALGRTRVTEARELAAELDSVGEPSVGVVLVGSSKPPDDGE